MSYDKEAEAIEMDAAYKAYDCGLGCGEWEAFLTHKQTLRLIELADMGHGTWANEPEQLVRIKDILKQNECEA